jgi:hypothetical protein
MYSITHIAKTFINGLASSYDSTFPVQLNGIVDNIDYNSIIGTINDELFLMWPCCFCFSYGYIFSLCTAGMSFCFPYVCISDAKKTLLQSIAKANERYFHKKGLELSYQSKCSTSWLQIDISQNQYNDLTNKDNKIVFSSNQL